MMTERRMRHLPVIAQGRLAGIVSIGDIKHLLDEKQLEIPALTDYIAGKYPGERFHRPSVPQYAGDGPAYRRRGP
jgi:hypothetical protein